MHCFRLSQIILTVSIFYFVTNFKLIDILNKTLSYIELENVEKSSDILLGSAIAAGK